jgi:hypothetical protein
MFFISVDSKGSSSCLFCYTFASVDSKEVTAKESAAKWLGHGTAENAAASRDHEA